MSDAAPQLYMVFDVESVGLHGEGFAVGWVVIDDQGTEYEHGLYSSPRHFAAGSASGHDWIAKHVPDLPETHTSARDVRSAFWTNWLRNKKRGAVLVADCAWPVEARFLADCANEDLMNREWQGPYPLHDLATARFLAGFDPLATVDRRVNELPQHNPLADARQSARLWLEALEALRAHG